MHFIKFIKEHKILRSFRLRIFLIILLTGLCALGFMRRVLTADAVNMAIESREAEMMTRLRIMADRIGNSIFMQDTTEGTYAADLMLLSSVFDSRIIAADSELKIVYDSYDNDTGHYLISDVAVKAFRDGAVSGYDKEAGLIEIAIPVTVYDSDLKADITEGVLVAAASPEKILRDVAEKERRSVIIEILAIVLLTGVAAAVASVVVRPFDKVTGAIRSAASFDDSTPAVSDYKETEEIVEAFNEMRTQMKALDQSRQEFVGNVSHELKTPMASIKVLADSINMQSDAPVEVYRDFMKDISEEIDRENNIISDLLALVKMDKGVGALNIENKNINMLLENIIRRLGPLAKKNEVDIVFESIRQVDADVDETKISSAFMNLIENGIKYNKKPGWVRVKLDADHRFFTVTVSDSGMGIPEESLPHIFERFYRVDKSHSREIGGTGLGLAITRRTILLHRGSIKAESVLGEGTVFTVRIPVGYIA